MKKFTACDLTGICPAPMITPEQMDIIATYMNDDIREDLHGKYAPCTPDYFLEKYVECDPDFSEILEGEFGIYW